MKKQLLLTITLCTILTSCITLCSETQQPSYWQQLKELGHNFIEEISHYQIQAAALTLFGTTASLGNTLIQKGTISNSDLYKGLQHGLITAGFLASIDRPLKGGFKPEHLEPRFIRNWGTLGIFLLTTGSALNSILATPPAIKETLFNNLKAALVTSFTIAGVNAIIAPTMYIEKIMTNLYNKPEIQTLTQEIKKELEDIKKFPTLQLKIKYLQGIKNQSIKYREFISLTAVNTILNDLKSSNEEQFNKTIQKITFEEKLKLALKKLCDELFGKEFGFPHKPYEFPHFEITQFIQSTIDFLTAKKKKFQSKFWPDNITLQAIDLMLEESNKLLYIDNLHPDIALKILTQYNNTIPLGAPKSFYIWRLKGYYEKLAEKVKHNLVKSTQKQKVR